MRVHSLYLLASFPVSQYAFDIPSAVSISSSLYRESLQHDPLMTKVATGAVLAVAGDAIAQSTNAKKLQPSKGYNPQQAASFALFDASYRAVQHWTYPHMLEACHGQVLGPVLHSTALAAAVEQTLVSQGIIIPVVYYPVFFFITGAVQGLTWSQSVERARTTFVPLLFRNWMFWVPVQYGIFAYCPEDYQISVMIVCGLVWTILLSFFAGSAAAKPTVQDGYTATSDGMDEGEVGVQTSNANAFLNVEQRVSQQ